jgi:hypothetical protein
VDYSTAQAVFLGPPPEGRPAPRVPDTPARRLRDAAEPIATTHFWSERTNARLAELGLDFLTGYVWSRSAPLGRPAPSVVAAVMGAFEPGMITGLAVQAQAAADRDDVLRAREEATVEHLGELLAREDVGAAAAQLRRAVEALAGQVAGRPLFAGLVSMPWPESPLGQLWHAACTLRECRGDVHQAASITAGLSGTQMNLVTEYWVGWEHTAFTATRGWSADAMAAADADLVGRGLVAHGALTDEGRRLRDGIEERTDAALAPALAAIGDDLDALVERLDGWSARIIDGGAAPQDPYKRVSG